MKKQGKLRKHHSPEFKFKVVLEALMGQKTFARGKKAHAPEPIEDIAYFDYYHPQGTSVIAMISGGDNLT